MVKSMTGYGGAKDSCQGYEISVELKSVNNRYLDTSVRMPRNFLFAEEAVKALIQEHISRGKVDVFVNVDACGTDAIVVSVNEALAKSYIDALNTLSADFSLSNELTALSVGRLPDVLNVEKKETDKDAVLEALRSITENALKEFDAMRTREGGKLSEDIESRLNTIESLVAEVESRSPQTVSEYREKLRKKMCEVLESTSIDEQRILQEAALFADKVAVDEETVRLRSHVSQMRAMLREGSPIGRKMDFLVQEFNREANTIGSKCNDSNISKIVIELKSEIEKIREQVQNIE